MEQFEFVNDGIRTAVQPFRQLVELDPLSLVVLEVTMQTRFKRHFSITSDD
jgi:hypothetical protein